ncbi:hypothetical protein SDC9_57983 [bioreactor metagenome]|uniref:Uncharacterized protein n=1 Tax=bioreactor metagenome TaxID=1076179 RepID=A0A644X668_9ZZZZ
MIEFLTKYQDVIGVFSGIGTFISALIAVFTLREVKKQRLSLYKPEILIKSFSVFISKSVLTIEEDELLQFKVSDHNEYSTSFKSVEYEVSTKYKVNNLGFGIAKNIICKWEFDIEKAINMLNEIMPQNYSLLHNKYINTYILKFNDEYLYSANADIYQQDIDYVSPVNIQNHYHLHVVPEIIIFTHHLYLLLKHKLIKKNGDNFNYYEFNEAGFPKPALRIQFNDLNNKLYKRNFEFSVFAVATEPNVVLDLTQEFSYLLFKIE